MGGYGAIVDYPSTARLLALHELDRLLRTEKSASKICVDDRPPLFVGHVFKRYRRSSYARIIEKEIQPPERLDGVREESPDGPWVADTCRNAEHSRAQFRALHRSSLQGLFPTAGHNDRIPFIREGNSDSPANSAAAAGDDGNLSQRTHAHPLLECPPSICRERTLRPSFFVLRCATRRRDALRGHRVANRPRPLPTHGRRHPRRRHRVWLPGPRRW